VMNCPESLCDPRIAGGSVDGQRDPRIVPQVPNLPILLCARYPECIPTQ
jgi:hypothetical protein